ncbi:type I-E CRISPR-associated protein Cas6/Cse3/CasE [Actinomadura harenae]|uniref:Type I-E CRISPR-associated protein Cas6/Cse3/CasE n=1 Tax=Actinomadura harenae TaxID=2483351 RepID=A0A3M2M4Z1_9ACTN|nr:type I-E CRISPR-associated protein Cas6/Cse3/CasE [Actinomadura harenae]RMI44090.1 type I-E CRISPR-associated protein Cas6/Cse3/CasE [Actinomadura harenae]
MTTELWITQILPNQNRLVLSELNDAVKLHRRIMTLFPEQLGPTPRQRAAVLFRLDEAPTGFSILAQSALKPDVNQLPADYGTALVKPLTPLLGHLSRGVNVHYRITANATRKLGKNTTAGRPKEVVPLLGAEADQWWVRQAESIGLALHTVHSSQLANATGRHRHGRLTHARTRFDGTATVTDPAILIHHVQSGIGRAKAFGCGLLTLAPATR